MAASFDISKARDHFPALKQPNQVYFDNAGGSQTLGTVIESITSYLSGTNVQLGASYSIGKKSTAIYNSGYEAAAKYINASVDNIVLGSSTTQLFRNLSYSLDLSSPGAEIIISTVDHEANIAPWIALAARQNLTIKWWTPKSSNNPQLLVSDLKELLSEKTALVTCTHASNILGTITDIKAVSTLVHNTVPGALVCVDAVAFAPHRQIDVQDLGVDFYSFSWYKVYGPHMSMLYASENGLKTVKTLGHFFNPSETLQHKLGLAGSSYELVASIPALLEYLGPDMSASWAEIAKHEELLQGTLLTYLNEKAGVTVIGESDADPKKRVSTVSFLVEGKKSEDIVAEVEERTNGEIGIRWGGFYSERLREGVLGLEKDGVVRVSMVHYNTVDEVKRLLEVLDQVIG